MTAPPTIGGQLVKPVVKQAAAPPLRRVGPVDVQRIEVALVCGVSAHDVIAIWGISYTQLRTIRERMAG